MFSTVNIIAGIITGAFGMGYFIYGKKRGRMITMLSGVGLIIYPYLVSSTPLMIILGLVLLALPFVFRE